jgi:hypothetical protein
MPPAGLPRPAQATVDSVASELEAALDRAAAERPNPGRPAIHRLNRTEYSNAIRDLLALDTTAIDVKSFLPGDDSGYGFDNIGDVLSVSPLLLERYMFAAEKISRLAVGNPAILPSSEEYAAPKALVQEDHMGDDFPLGTRGGLAVRHHFPLDAEYVIRARINGIAGPDVAQVDVRVDGERLKLFNTDANTDIRFKAKAGSRLVAVFFVKDTVKPAPRRGGSGAVGGITILGPYNATGSGQTPSRDRIFICRPAAAAQEQTCARKILSALARRAYRRPVGDPDVDPLLRLYTIGRSDGSFDAGVEMALRGILTSPGFLFRLERDPAGATPGPHRISDLELASRLSFFLWSSIPDETLLNLAEQRKLTGDPRVLEQQVRRMAADPRSKALSENFAGQWLYLRNARTVQPDPAVFPEFDENLRQAMQKETELLFDSMLREDRSVVDLLDADYTFVNERLARHYGIPNVFGSNFRRVSIDRDERRGLLGQASILTVTSYATRTSPTLRGKWLLENILGTPPPPPPDDVPSLKDDGRSQAKTMRQRMDEHRTNPVCASCHARMDPMGFALENFDAIGRWRTVNESDTSRIDASGVLPDGTRFEGPAELRKLLLKDRVQFVGNVTEKLLTYALGRGTEYYDAPVIRKTAREAAAHGYRWSSLILGIVNSAPFQMRSAPTP